MHTKIVYANDYSGVIVVFMNALNLHFTLNRFILSLFPYFKKNVTKFFAPICKQLLLCIKVFFSDTQILYSYINNKSKVDSLSTWYKNNAASGFKMRKQFNVL